MYILIEQLFKNSFVLTIDEERFNTFKKIFQYHRLPIPRKYEGFSFKNYYDHYWDKKHVKTIEQQINCSYGHASIIKLAQYLYLPFVCIFEDDAYPCFDIKSKLEHYLKDVPDDADCLLLGNNGWLESQKYNSKFVKVKNNGIGTHAYIIFKNAYEKILNSYNTDSAIADHVFKNLNTYSPIQNLFIQYNKQKSMNNYNLYTWINHTQEQIFKEFPRIEEIIKE